jgi:catechol 2,3-dioxygenase-like lactoylglutathione lyase family enzyme
MESSGCGCPPTAPVASGPGRVHHVFVNVRHLERSRDFYAWLMPQLGYPGTWDFEGQGASAGFLSPAGSFWLKQQDVRFMGDAFHKDRVGLCEIAFAAASRADVDALAAALVARGVTILHPPREYPEYVPGYYAVFFADPDGIKLEAVHIPG